MLKKSITHGFLLALLFAAQSAMAQESGAEARMAEVRRAMDGVARISGTFTQRKKLEFLNDPVVSHGKFVFARPDSLTWEYVSPAPSGLKAENGEVTIWNGPPEKRVNQSGALAGAAAMLAGQIMMWMNFNPPEILALYEVRVAGENPMAFEVEPRQEGLKKRLKSITIVLDDDIRAVRSVTLAENEATTTLIFDAIKFDAAPAQGTAK